MLSGVKPMIGSGSLTVMVMLATAEPPLWFAQTVYSVRVMLTVGVPEMSPLLNTKPSGNSGSIAHEDGTPLVRFGSRVSMARSRVSVRLEGS